MNNDFRSYEIRRGPVWIRFPKLVGNGHGHAKIEAAGGLKGRNCSLSAADRVRAHAPQALTTRETAFGGSKQPTRTRQPVVGRVLTTPRAPRLVPISTQRLRTVLEWVRIDAEGKQKSDEALVFSNEVGEPLPHFHDAWFRTVLKAHSAFAKAMARQEPR